MAVILSLLQFSLQVRTCRVKRMKTAPSVMLTLDFPKMLNYCSFQLEENSDNRVLWTSAILQVFLFHLELLSPNSPVKAPRVLRGVNQLSVLYFRSPDRPARHSVRGESRSERPNCFLSSKNTSMANRNKTVIKILKNNFEVESKGIDLYLISFPKWLQTK